MRDEDNEASTEALAPGPYFHGSRRLYRPNEFLLTDVVNNIPGEEDGRRMSFATLSVDDALDWAYRRGIRHRGDTLYVYEVEMVDPEVDVNVHQHVASQRVTSVMSSRGRVIRLFHQVAVADYPGAFFG